MRRIFQWRRDKSDESDRLPPGQRLTSRFPVLHHGNVPKTDMATWDFRVFGMVEEELVWSWDEFLELPRREVVMDIHCVTRWSKFDTRWEGVSVKRLQNEGIIKLKPGARYVIQHCEHGFKENLPLDIVLSDNFILATHYDGKPLTPEHGFPLRGVIGSFPDRSEEKTTYLWKGGKWLRSLEFRADDQPGFWEMAGYHNEADPWKEQRFSNM